MSYQEFFTPDDLYEDPAACERVKLVALTTAILHGAYIIAHRISNAKINGAHCVSQAESEVMRRFYQS
jgi:hypothetical protein